jgi:nitrite reductase/ring-hydroxylating ferredoxin subunit
MSGFNRRQFVTGAAAGFCCCLAGCQSGPGESAVAEALQEGTLDIGTAADYPRDGAYGRFIARDRVIVIRKSGTISAVTAICPHKRFLLEPLEGGGTIACPEHGSLFDLDGRVTKGPAKNDLTHYALTIGPAGRIIVDRSRKLSAGDPASVVQV